MNNRAELRVQVSNKIERQAGKYNASTALKELVAGLSNGTVGLRESSRYITGRINGTDTEIFKQVKEQKDRVGLTNFDGDHLARGTNFIVTHATILYGTKSTTDDVDPRVVTYGVSSIDPAIKAGEFSFKGKGDVILKNIIHLLHNSKTTVSNDDLFLEIGDLPIIESEAPLTATFNLPDDLDIVTAGDKKHFVKVIFKGFETYQK